MSFPRSEKHVKLPFASSSMRVLKVFSSLSWADQSLLLEAALLVGIVRTALWFFPFRTVQRILFAMSKPSRATHSADRIVWSVMAVSPYLPRATCLTQALAGQALLARSGYKSRVEIGVAKDEQRRFEAHAWLVFREHVVIGGRGVEHYTPLTAWENRP